MNKKTQRLSSIVDILRERGNVTVQDLASHLGVSLMTIRRDLYELQSNGIVERNHGGAVLQSGAHSHVFENIESIYNLSWARVSMSDQKKRIARYAAGLIEPDDIVIFDNGSTTDCLVDYIPADMQLTVACYNLNILVKLANREKTKIIFAGGYFHPSDQMFESKENNQFLSTIRANKVFISASGVHNTLGLTCAHDFEVSVKQTVLKSALQKILVADSSKFGAVKTAYFANLDVLDTIITDSELSDEWIDIIRDKGIELVMV